MNTKANAEARIAEFLKPDQQVLLLNGTNSQAKHVLAMQVVRQYLPAATVLFRTNNQQHAAGLSGRFHTDTFNVRSQNLTPRDVDVAVIWPTDPLGPDKGGELISDLRLRGVKKIILTTWIDNRDVTWVDNYDPVRVTYDAEVENVHRATKEIEANFRVDVPSNLPGYAKDVDPKYLCKIQCDTCRASRWAKLDKPYPGIDVLRNADMGDYVATCLKCGDENRYNHNWYER